MAAFLLTVKLAATDDGFTLLWKTTLADSVGY